MSDDNNERVRDSNSSFVKLSGTALDWDIGREPEAELLPLIPPDPDPEFDFNGVTCCLSGLELETVTVLSGDPLCDSEGVGWRSMQSITAFRIDIPRLLQAAVDIGLDCTFTRK